MKESKEGHTGVRGRKGRNDVIMISQVKEKEPSEATGVPVSERFAGLFSVYYMTKLLIQLFNPPHQTENHISFSLVHPIASKYFVLPSVLSSVPKSK